MTAISDPQNVAKPLDSEIGYSKEEDRALIVERLVRFYEEEVGFKIAVEARPDWWEMPTIQDSLRVCANYDADVSRFSPAELEEMTREAKAIQEESGQSNAAFWTQMVADQKEFTRLKKMVPSAGSIKTRKIEPREVLLAYGATPVFYKASINMLWAYRGIGKSIVADVLAKVMTQGGEWLGFKSEGGHNVLLCDGELPAAQIQERVREFINPEEEDERLRIWSPEFGVFPNFGAKRKYITADKAKPGEKVGWEKHPLVEVMEAFKPKVIIFDTLTRCFRFDTNDTEQCLYVNDLLVNLRQLGVCVLIVHHAGKNATQRGRTDIDDNLDVSIKLDKPYGWAPGDGLAFQWGWEKVRHGGHLPGFEAEYSNPTGKPEDGVWRLATDSRTAEVLEMHKAGKSQRAVATALDLSQPTVNRIIRRAEQDRLDELNRKVSKG